MENLFPDNFDSYMSTIQEKIHLDGQQMVVSIKGYPFSWETQGLSVGADFQCFI